MERMSSKQVAVRELAPSVSLTAEKVTNVGAVSDFTSPNRKVTPLKPFRVDLTSASGAAKNYIIGDPSAMLANMKGGTIVSPDAASINVAAMKAIFAYAPVAIKAINYEVTSSATQFNNTFQLLIGDIDGTYQTVDLPVAAAKRNNQYNAKILTLEFDDPIILSWNKALYIVVNDGEDVYLWFTPAGAANRY